jgi:hypothetical protein
MQSSPGIQVKLLGNEDLESHVRLDPDIKPAADLSVSDSQLMNWSVSRPNQFKSSFRFHCLRRSDVAGHRGVTFTTLCDRSRNPDSILPRTSVFKLNTGANDRKMTKWSKCAPLTPAPDLNLEQFTNLHTPLTTG